MNPTTTTLLEPVDLRARIRGVGEGAGVVNAVRFIHQFERSRLDQHPRLSFYAKLPVWSVR